MSHSIRKAAKKDLEAVDALLAEIRAWLQVKGLKQWQTPHPRATLEREIERGEVFVLHTDAGLTGCVTLTFERDSYWPTPANALYLHRLAVRKSHSGAGFGKELLKSAIAETTRRGIPLLRLDCLATNAVLKAYYENEGFTYVGLGYEGQTGYHLFEMPIARL